MNPVEEACNLYRGVFEHASDAIIVTDAQGVIRLVNPAVEALFGYAAGDLVGREIEVLVPVSLAEEHVQRRREFTKSPRSRPMGSGRDLLARKRDGTLFPVDIALGPSRTGQGDLLIAAVIRDASVRRVLEERDRLMAKVAQVVSEPSEVRERLKAAAGILATALSSWCVIDLLEENGTLSRAATGAPPGVRADVVDRLRAYRPPQPFTNGILRCIHERSAVLVQRVDHDGTERALAHDTAALGLFQDMEARSYMILPLVARDRALGAMSLVSSGAAYDESTLGFCRKLADRIALSADNARLYEEAQRAVRARQDMVAIVSHDLRDPISSLNLSLQLLSREIEGAGLSDERAKSATRLLQVMERSTQKAFQLISDLLDSGKLESGKFAVETKAEDPVSILEEAVASFEARAAASMIRLRLERGGALPPVAADRARIAQVLSNLVGNALKFTPRNGEVRLSAVGRGNEVVVSVKDTGTGVPPESIPRLFDRYWQPERTRRQGTGLGLSIAKGIVEAHGGRIWVDSPPGEGAEFSFTLSKARA